MVDMKIGAVYKPLYAEYYLLCLKHEEGSNSYLFLDKEGRLARYFYALQSLIEVK